MTSPPARSSVLRSARRLLAIALVVAIAILLHTTLDLGSAGLH